jgi:diguanylate cyclase (GGDEF)-like protein
VSDEQAKQIARLERKLLRVEAARNEAEQLLESKTLALYTALRDAESARDQLYAQANSDPLTGLANRRQLEHTFEQLFALNIRDAGIAIGLLLIDLDGFKPINDNYGHEVGDWVLHQIGQRLTVAARATDCVARIGGDEFVILCTQIRGPGDLHTVAERVRREIMKPVRVEDRSSILSASIGYAMGSRSSTLGQLLREADTAMYHAKRTGKNRATAYGDVPVIDTHLIQ